VLAATATAEPLIAFQQPHNAEPCNQASAAHLRPVSVLPVEGDDAGLHLSKRDQRTLAPCERLQGGMDNAASWSKPHHWTVHPSCVT
jgi:hypothetical protein